MMIENEDFEMKIYVDYDDCLCETGRAFTVIAERLFGKKVPYEEVRFFNLQDSFKLTDDEYEQILVEGHLPEVLLSFEETPGASKVINKWIDRGYEVDIITGRPYSTCEVSRRWLDNHGLSRVNLLFLNKYGRDLFYKKNDNHIKRIFTVKNVLPVNGVEKVIIDNKSTIDFTSDAYVEKEKMVEPISSGEGDVYDIMEQNNYVEATANIKSDSAMIVFFKYSSLSS